jgi:formylglycine-generating enzyme required for sulfatase activity
MGAVPLLMLAVACGQPSSPVTSADAADDGGSSDVAETTELPETADEVEPVCSPIAGRDPKAPEPCNGRDDDCDGLTDEDDATCHCGRLPSPCPADYDCVEGRCLSADNSRLFVPGDSFWMGCNPSRDHLCGGGSCINVVINFPLPAPKGCGAPGSDELPQVKHHLQSFAIDRYPATLLDYHACVQSEKCVAGPNDQLCRGPFCPRISELPLDKAELRKPMLWVSWEEARTFCGGQGGRLCTESEWEMAARGGCSLYCSPAEGDDCCRLAMPMYPWGDTVAPCGDSPVAFYRCECDGGLDPSNSVPLGRVDAHPAGASPYGVEDMVGNVGQWVDGCYDCYDSDPSPVPATCAARLVRGYEFSSSSGVPCQKYGVCDACWMSPPSPAECEPFSAGWGLVPTHRAGSRFAIRAGYIGTHMSGIRCCYDAPGSLR